MKILKNNIFRFMMVLTVAVASSCQSFNMDVEDSPNALSPDKADINLFMNATQVGLNSLWQSGNAFGMQLTRMTHMFGPLYQNAYSPQSFDGMWSNAYATVLQDVKTAKALADNLGLPNHRAVLKIIEAYTLMIMVDSYGDVPYSEANLGVGNLAPGLDDDEDVYDAALGLLNSALDDIALANAFIPSDLYRGSNDFAPFWTRVANTLKLRAYLNTGNAAGFSATLSEPLISAATWDLEFKYSTNLANPPSRHPQYGAVYDNGATVYMSNSYMQRFISPNDPRRRLYFYRQRTSNSTDVNAIPCITQPKPAWYSVSDVYCQLTVGYWGRDHGNNDGIPPDALLRTIWGVYPVGGKFDNSQNERGRQGEGAGGAGISPMMSSFMVNFMRAEAAITLGTGEDARALLSAAIDGSMAKVTGYAATVGYSITGLSNFPTAASLITYRDDRLAEYDAATTDAERLAIIATEYYKALFGNGHETYNLYRRTGLPANMQPTMKVEDPGSFVNSFWFPANAVNRNSNIPQKSVADRVFWAPVLDLK